MEKINLNGLELYYRVFHYEGEYGTGYSKTKFFEKGAIKQKKYYLFGKLVSREKYIYLFEVPLDIESPRVSKIKCKKEIDIALNQFQSVMKRKRDIKQGKFI